MHKQSGNISTVPECPKEPLGASPATLAKRDHFKPSAWCPITNIEYDPSCDADNPKTILYKDVLKAATVIRADIPYTPIVRSKCCIELGSEINYKFESLNTTGSFHERGALYSLQMLNNDQRLAGVYTASMGNWGKALAYQARRLKIRVTVIFPENTFSDVIEKCEDLGATVLLHGKNLAEAKRQAFFIINERGHGTYINGYDHPHVIAASGTIGIEILEQLPQTDAILVPIGGGGLIAGIATVVKKLKPEILIYGIQPKKCCSFFKAIENERPYQTEAGRSLAQSLAVPTAGYNAYHTAVSLIDKMVLVDDDWISRAILHFAEEEKTVVEGAGATSLSALLSLPHILPELREKTVVCIITGNNVDNYTFVSSLERAKAIEGRLIKVTITLGVNDMKTYLRVLNVIANVGASIRNSYTDHAWILKNDFETIYITLVCETQNLDHACKLKRIMTRIFPGMCDFLEEPFSPIPMCACVPRRIF